MIVHQPSKGDEEKQISIIAMVFWINLKSIWVDGDEENWSHMAYLCEMILFTAV